MPNTAGPSHPRRRKAGARTPGSAHLGAAILTDAAWTEVARSLHLSARQTRIARGVFDNHKVESLAADLGISEHTVHRHLNRLFLKLRVNTRSQLVLCVIQQLLSLTLSDESDLPAICRNRASGRCPLSPPSRSTR